MTPQKAGRLYVSYTVHRQYNQLQSEYRRAKRKTAGPLEKSEDLIMFQFRKDFCIMRINIQILPREVGGEMNCL